MAPTEQPRHRSLADILEVVRRRKRIVLIPLVLVPLVATLLGLQQPPTFRSSSEVLVSRKDLGSALGVGFSDGYVDPERATETQAILARSPKVAQAAVTASRIDGLTAQGLLDISAVEPRGNADVLRFTVDYGDPGSVAALATAYAEAFADYRLALDTATVADARKDLERTLATLRRKGSAATPLYRSIAQKAQDLRTIELLQSRPAIVRVASTGEKVAPTPMRNAVLGLGLGLLLGIGAALLWEALDRRVRDEAEIEQLLGGPLLSRIPERRSSLGRNDRLEILTNPNGIEAEAVRRLRSSVQFANVDVKASSILVASAAQGEGKTTVACQLAIALARSGNRVALIDLDLRRPGVSRTLGIAAHPGVTDVASGRVTLAQALVPVAVTGPPPRRRSAVLRRGVEQNLPPDAASQLWAIPSGSIPVDPGELVETPAIASMLHALTLDMDYVIVDSPPMIPVNDAMTLSTRVDAILVVVRDGVATRQMVRDVARQLEVCPARMLGFVLIGSRGSGGYPGGEYTYRNDDAELASPTAIGAGR